MFRLFADQGLRHAYFWCRTVHWALTAAHGWEPLFSLPNNIVDGHSVGYAFRFTITVTISGNASEL